VRSSPYNQKKQKKKKNLFAIMQINLSAICSYSKMEKVSAELFCFTYGAMVSQLLRHYKDPAEVVILHVAPLISSSASLIIKRLKCLFEQKAQSSQFVCLGFDSPGEDGPFHRQAL
jgi:hypothetical protein